MAIAAPWIGTTVEGSVAGVDGTSAVVDVSGATNGEVVWIIGAVADSQTALIAAPAGWSILGRVSEGATGASSSQAVIFWKIKASTDTTVTISWTALAKRQFTPVSWPGVATAGPAEGLTWLTRSAGGSTSYTTGTATPTTANRWAVAVFVSRGTTASVAWTPDAATTSRAAVINTGSVYLGLHVADTNAAVTAAAHSYTAMGQNASHGIGAVFFLIPSGAVVASGTLTGTLPAFTSVVNGTARASATLPGTLPTLTGQFNGAVRTNNTLDGVLPAMTGTFTGNAITTVDISIAVAPTRLLLPTTVASTRGGVQSGSTRPSRAVGDTRTGTAAQPTRRDRG